MSAFRPRPVPAHQLRPRTITGAYPFRDHRTVAQQDGERAGGSGNLRPAPAGLTPAVVDRFLALADLFGGAADFTQDASTAATIPIAGEVQASSAAAEEAGRGLPGRLS